MSGQLPRETERGSCRTGKRVHAGTELAEMTTRLEVMICVVRCGVALWYIFARFDMLAIVLRVSTFSELMCICLRSVAGFSITKVRLVGGEIRSLVKQRFFE